MCCTTTIILRTWQFDSQNTFVGILNHARCKKISYKDIFSYKFPGSHADGARHFQDLSGHAEKKYQTAKLAYLRYVSARIVPPCLIKRGAFSRKKSRVCGIYCYNTGGGNWQTFWIFISCPPPLYNTYVGILVICVAIHFTCSGGGRGGGRSGQIPKFSLHVFKFGYNFQDCTYCAFALLDSNSLHSQ